MKVLSKNLCYFRKIWKATLVKLVTSVQQSVNGRPIIRLCTIVHYSSAFFPYFAVAIYIFPCCTSLCCTLYMLHFFHTAPFPCCTFLCNNLFGLHSFYVLLYFMLDFYTFQYFQLAFFSCYTRRMLHFVHVPLFPEVQ